MIASSKLTRCLDRFDAAFQAVPVESHLQYVPKLDWHVEAQRQTSDLLSQVVEQRLRVLQIARVEAFGEPGVERGEEGAGFIALALALPEPRQAGGGAQLERLGLLPPGYLQGLDGNAVEEAEALFGLLPPYRSRSVDGRERICEQTGHYGFLAATDGRHAGGLPL